MEVSINGGYPNSWVLPYNGQPYWSGWFGGIPILRHVKKSPYDWLHHKIGRCSAKMASVAQWGVNKNHETLVGGSNKKRTTHGGFLKWG